LAETGLAAMSAAAPIIIMAEIFVVDFGILDTSKLVENVE